MRERTTWLYCGKPILHESEDGTYELAEGVSEREALDFCVKNIQAMRDERERERRMAETFRAVQLRRGV